MVPLNDCQSDGLPGVKWGDAGKCYTYEPGDEAGRAAAVAKALAQAVAIGDLPADETASAAPNEARAAEDVDLTPTAEMADVAAKGLRLHEEGKSGDGLVAATVRDARRMANREPLSMDKVRRMPAWWARHSDDWTAADTEPGEESPGYVAALLWGVDSRDGSPGATWAARKVAEMDRADEERQGADGDDMERHDDMTTRDLPDNYRLALEDDVPAGRACGNCRFYDESDRRDEMARCRQWDEYVRGDHYCNAWESPEDAPPATDSPPADEAATNPADRVERGVSPARFEWRESGAGPDYRTVVGYAAVWDSMSEDLGGFREVIKRGAFSDALTDADDIRFLIGHDMDTVMARTSNGTLELSEDDIGLRVWARIALDDPDAQRLDAKLRSGAMSQMSFAFTMPPDGSGENWDYSGGVPVRSVERVGMLYEVSAVGAPAYTASTIAARAGILDDAISSGRLPDAGAADAAPDSPVDGTPQAASLGTDAHNQRRAAAKWAGRLARIRKEVHNNG